MPTLTIPSPILGFGELFDVEIQNSIGDVVYSATQTNSPFDPGIFTGGDYVMYVTYDGTTNGWCFSIPVCECPDFVGVDFFQSGPNYYADVTFNIPDGDLQCPFYIFGSSAFTSYDILINDISDFTSNVGDDYTKRILVGGSTFITVGVRQQDGTICEAEATYTVDCTGPTISSVSLVYEGGDYKIRVVYGACGTCNDMTLSATQTPSGAAGIFPHTVVCSPFTSTYDFVIIPTVTPGQDVTFNIVITNCCGTNQSFTRTITATCSPVQPASVTLYESGGEYFIDFVFNNCGASCHSIYIAGSQVANGSPLSFYGASIHTESSPGVVGFATIPCGGSFPYTLTLPASSVVPNPPVGYIQWAYEIKTCCAPSVSTGPFYTNTLPLP